MFFTFLVLFVRRPLEPLGPLGPVKLNLISLARSDGRSLGTFGSSMVELAAACLNL